MMPCSSSLQGFGQKTLTNKQHYCKLQVDHPCLECETDWPLKIQNPKQWTCPPTSQILRLRWFHWLSSHISKHWRKSRSSTLTIYQSELPVRSSIECFGVLLVLYTSFLVLGASVLTKNPFTLLCSILLPSLILQTKKSYGLYLFL